jgi:hypothetical protein
MLSEAIADWNLRHSEAEALDTRNSEWRRLYWAILAFLRHRLTPYDQTLQESPYDPALRDQLFRRIQAAAHFQYKWLRLETDPRTKETQDKADARRPFDRVAADLSDLYTHKNALFQALREARCKGTPPLGLDSLENELAETESRIKRLEQKLPSAESKEAGRWIMSGTLGGSGIISSLLGKLCPNQWMPENFGCPKCGVRVMRTKRAMPLGQGQQVFFWWCRCAFCAVHLPPSGSVPRRLRLEDWSEYLEGIAKETKEPA